MLKKIEGKIINMFKIKLIKKTFLYDVINRLLDKVKPNGISKYEIKKLLKKEKPVILEIGAHDGADTIAFLQIIKKVKLYCIEPNPEAISKFKERILELRKRKRKIDCSLFEIAISDKNGNVEFYLTSKNEYSAQATLKKPKEVSNQSQNIWENGKTIIVKTKKLDDWVKEQQIKEIDFIWADVEGAEKELIKGGLKTLNEKTRYFYTEFENKGNFKDRLDLNGILELLPNFKLLKIYENNALLKNIKLKNSP
ncbi:unnamed protein product [marine sediment metagenome]|uniref:Methyltransferase FkbM domain-containing protein n=1 Tax=marine sediment metagenome TaxID=412755 RepID=X0T2J4_9ZZZZ